MPPPHLKFTQADLNLFSAASHDVNPMHMDAEYARKTAFGEPVVFGILGTLAALGQTRDRNDVRLSSVSLTFHSTMLRDIGYRTVVKEKSPEKTAVDIFDASRLVLTAVFTYRPCDGADTTGEFSASPQRTKPCVWTEEELTNGITMEGTYSPDFVKLHELIQYWGIGTKGVTTSQIAVLVWSSYLVGMELPGESALYSRLQLTFATPSIHFPLRYQAKTVALDPRFHLLKIGLDVESEGVSAASGRVEVLIRPDSPVSSMDQLKRLLPQEARLRGKTALVIGGSRGFGAALAQGLALQGARVFLAYQYSTSEAEAVRDQVKNAAGTIELVQGDATDGTWLKSLRQTIQEDNGGLDILVCNACPPIRALTFAPETIDRFQEFVTQSIALVSVPAAAVIDLLAERDGWNVVISSEFVRTIPSQWPHYVTAKHAIEGMAYAIGAQQPRVHSLIVRPPRLLTDQTNTPMGRMDAMPVEVAAAAVVRRLSEPAATETMEQFPLLP